MATGFATYGTLLNNEVALTKQSSIRGFSIKSFQAFGNVNAVNYACITVNVGQSALFTVEDAILVTAYGQDYYLIDEGKLIFRENL